MYGYIYKTTNLINQHVYIGQKKGEFNPEYLGSGKLIVRAVHKYGVRKFKVVQIASAENRKELDVLEKYYINKYRKSYVTYNISDGGLGWHITHVSEEKKRNQSKSRLRYYKNPLNRLNRSISAKEAALRFKEEGKINSGQFKKGQRSWNTGKHPKYVQGKNHPMYGKNHLPETLEKIRLAKLGRTKETDEGVARQAKALTGRKASTQTRLKMRKSRLSYLKKQKEESLCPSYR